MKEFELDGRLCRDRGDFCVRLGTLLSFPAGFGKNLDALNDCLTSLPEPTKLTVTYFDGLEKRLGDWGKKLRKLLQEVSDGKNLQVELPESPVTTPEQINAIGSALETNMTLRYSPIAMKLLWSEEDIPEGTIRPFRDQGNRLAMYQAYALVRRDRRALTLLKEDHWCVWPLVSYKICPLDDEDVVFMGTKFFVRDKERGVRYLRDEYPMLKGPAPIGFSIAPLKSCTFVPDLVTIYCNPAQIRSLLMACKYLTGDMLKVTLDPVDSCVHSSIPVLNGLDFNITFPDPGEYERGLTDEDEVMFTVRGDLVEPLLQCVNMLSKTGFGYQGLKMAMSLNFPRPAFYNAMFDKWGLATGPEWDGHK